MISTAQISKMTITMSVTILLLGASPSFSSSAFLVPAKVQAKLITEILRFEKTLKKRAGEQLLVGVIFPEKNTSFEHAAQVMVDEFEKINNPVIQGLKFSAALIKYRGKAALNQAIKDRGVDLVYVFSDSKMQINQISEIAGENKILSLASTIFGFENGLSVVIFVKNRRPAVQISLPKLNRAGIQFSSRFLRYAIVNED